MGADTSAPIPVPRETLGDLTPGEAQDPAHAPPVQFAPGVMPGAFPCLLCGGKFGKANTRRRLLCGVNFRKLCTSAGAESAEFPAPACHWEYITSVNN